MILVQALESVPCLPSIVHISSLDHSQVSKMMLPALCALGYENWVTQQFRELCQCSSMAARTCDRTPCRAQSDTSNILSIKAAILGFCNVATYLCQLLLYEQRYEDVLVLFCCGGGGVTMQIYPIVPLTLSPALAHLLGPVRPHFHLFVPYMQSTVERCRCILVGIWDTVSIV